MKALIFPLFSLLFLISCQKDVSTPGTQSKNNTDSLQILQVEIDSLKSQVDSLSGAVSMDSIKLSLSNVNVDSIASQLQSITTEIQQLVNQLSKAGVDITSIESELELLHQNLTGLSGQVSNQIPGVLFYTGVIQSGYVIWEKTLSVNSIEIITQYWGGSSQNYFGICIVNPNDAVSSGRLVWIPQGYWQYNTLYSILCDPNTYDLYITDGNDPANKGGYWPAVPFNTIGQLLVP